jgi:hypothetical protein
MQSWLSEDHHYYSGYMTENVWHPVKMSDNAGSCKEPSAQNKLENENHWFHFGKYFCGLHLKSFKEISPEDYQGVDYVMQILADKIAENHLQLLNCRMTLNIKNNP